jgi:hypothetical protein
MPIFEEVSAVDEYKIDRGKILKDNPAYFLLVHILKVLLFIHTLFFFCDSAN